MTSERPQRRPDIDWLRALAVLLLVPFHSALIFCNDGMLPLKSGENSEFLSYFAGIVSQWHMPLLFVISGMGTWFALFFRSPSEQVYLQRLNEGRFEGSLFAFYPHFFEGIYPEGNLTYNHLWFVAYLFVFSLIGFPVMKWKMSVGSRYLFVVVASILGTIVIYDLFVRRWRVARFLFGMKSGRRRSAQEEPRKY